MTAILADWNALVNNFTRDVTTYWRTRERRILALAILHGADINEIAKVIDPSGPVTPQAVYLNHPVSEIKKVQEDISKTLEENHEA